MNALEVKELIKTEKMIPILRTQSSDNILDIAAAAVDADCRILEFTMTIQGVIREISMVKEKYPSLVVGLGTVYNKQDAQEAIRAGADFIVSPILNLGIVDTVKSLDKMLMLSGFTPTEIYNAYNAGADIVKLFPASEMAPNFIRELKGPMPFLDIFPTGGLSLISAIQFLSYGAIAVGMGHSVFNAEMLARLDFDGVTALLRNAIYRVKNMSL